MSDDIDISEFEKKHLQERLRNLINEIHQELGITKRVKNLSRIRLNEYIEGSFELEYEVECYVTGGVMEEGNCGMKIELGKRYFNAKGEVIHIVKHYPVLNTPFMDRLGKTYKEDGHWYNSISKTNSDLICEVVEEILMKHAYGEISYQEMLVQHIEHWTRKKYVQSFNGTNIGYVENG